MSKCNGSVNKSVFDMMIMFDASQWRWGVTNGVQKLLRTLEVLGRTRNSGDINCQELLVAMLVIHTLAKNSTGVLILLCLDNSTAVAYTKKHGRRLIEGINLLNEESVGVVPGAKHTDCAHLKYKSLYVCIYCLSSIFRR